MSKPILQLTNVSIYQLSTLVLSKVNVAVEKGEFVYLIGKTGSGKSSLLKTLYGELPLREGRGHIVDFNLAALKEKDIPFLRRKLGIVFQDFKLLNDRTVKDNLYFVLRATGWKDKAKMNAKVDDVLSKVGIKEKREKFPHQISDGEKQRVAIARALLNDPELILADEPTGNLDPQTSLEIMEVLREINNNGNTIVMATHDYALILKYPYKTLKCDEKNIYEVVQKSV
ncbi:MAG: ATP-binding cassette domain-containing protein [Flavobacteriaceae bacterium]|nr:ATP-binding cassette domain-containing protein [Flavobacteriaceae bacterium]